MVAHGDPGRGARQDEDQAGQDGGGVVRDGRGGAEPAERGSHRSPHDLTGPEAVDVGRLAGPHQPTRHRLPSPEEPVEPGGEAGQERLQAAGQPAVGGSDARARGKRQVLQVGRHTVLQRGAASRGQAGPDEEHAAGPGEPQQGARPGPAGSRAHRSTRCSSGSRPTRVISQ